MITLRQVSLKVALMEELEINWTCYVSLSVLHLTVFSPHTVNQIKQQFAPVRTFETFKIDICCVSGMQIQDLASIIALCSPDAISVSHFILRLLNDI